MQLPKYHETFIPILKILSDGKIIHVNDLRKRVRDEFYSNLSQELLNKKVKSGDNLVLNRIHWGKTYLKQAKMVQQPERGMVQITDKGKSILNIGKLTLNELIDDPDFQARREARKEEKEGKRCQVPFMEFAPQGLTSVRFAPRGKTFSRKYAEKC